MISPVKRNGENEQIVEELGGFNDKVAKRIHEDGMEVSQAKSVVSASSPSPSLGAAMVTSLMPHGIKHTLRVKSLGVGLAAGVRRNVTVLNKRLKAFKKRLPRFKALRGVGVDTARIMRRGE